MSPGNADKRPDAEPRLSDRLAAAERPLRGMVRRLAGEGVRAHLSVDDLVQETLLRAHRSRASFHGDDEAALLAWLAAIARNVVRESARSAARAPSLEPRDPADSAVSSERATRREERFDRLRDALHDLSEDHRRVILLARVEGLPLGEIAGRMERSVEATSQLLWRALRKLRERFGTTDSLRLPDRRLAEDAGHRAEGDSNPRAQERERDHDDDE